MESIALRIARLRDLTRLQVNVVWKFALACQIELRSDQRRSQERGDDTAFAVESLADFGSDAIGVRASFREPFR
ncbi:hypothetical protein FHR20_001028 [Sphingomonas leidyi]|uniref:Uncharacterized protein n=1 Tax=Sphingomonas leidyi TaxID=68569 RepID=A0A7X5UYS1_9SPHN|nr:hypothetical protein [Sphingomonas leidyi]NIJ64097.1 hypothetical protein [Sphingomonas leidyi]